MNVVQNELYLINKCCNYVEYSIDNYNTYFDTRSEIINIQYRHGNIKHNPCADSPGWPASGRHKSHTKIDFFFKKNAVSHTTFAGRLTKSAGLIVHASFILEPPCLAIKTSLYLSLIM